MKPKSCGNVFVENMVRNSKIALRDEDEERIEREEVFIMTSRHYMPPISAYEGEKLRQGELLPL